MIMTDLPSIKHHFDEILEDSRKKITKLLSRTLFSINGTSFVPSDFRRAVEDLNSSHKLIAGNPKMALKDVILSSKLFLEDNKVDLFYEYCSNKFQYVKYEIDGIIDAFKNYNFSLGIYWPLEDVFFRLIQTPEHYFDLQILNSRKPFPEKLIAAIQKYISEIESIIEEINPEKIYNDLPKSNETPPRAELEKQSSFEDMFKSPHQAQVYVDILKQVEPPLINENGEYINGKLKSAICLWFELLQRKGKIRSDVERKEYTNLIKRKFNIPTFDSSNFDKISKRANEIYKSDFEILISQVSDIESTEN